MKSICTLVFLLLGIKSFSQAPVISLTEVATGFSGVVALAHCGDNRLFVVEQSGIIRSIRLYEGAENRTTFLDIRTIVKSGGEEGLLGLAFDPAYQQNGYFYVFYNNQASNLVVARYSVSQVDSTVADPSSAQILLTVNHPSFTNHNGGCLQFGPDGYLYIGTGDGGSGGDPNNNAQNGLSLLGKLLRIDPHGGEPYGIPESNPFIGNSGFADEIWAYGLRNPWRFSFDRLTGDLWIADVGQNAQEEINFQPAASVGGENYGWRCREGLNVYSSGNCSLPENERTDPVFAYPHAQGRSVTGGYVYRGASFDSLYGRYFFADFISGRIWSILPDGMGNYPAAVHGVFVANAYSTFGEDLYGELYLAQLSGRIVRITHPGGPRAAIQAPASAVCPGTPVELSTAYHPNLTYEWFLNGEPVAGSDTSAITAEHPGIYTVAATGQNGATTVSDTFRLIHHPVPEVTLSAETDHLCENASATELMGDPPGGAFGGPGVSGSMFFPAEAGPGEHIITYTYTDEHSCSSSTDSLALHVEICTSAGKTGKPDFSVSPNPSEGIFMLKLFLPAETIVNVKVRNMLGQVCFSKNSYVSGAVNLPLHLEAAPDGIYFLELTVDGERHISRLVKK